MHLSREELQQLLDRARVAVAVGKTYRHYKGTTYVVKDIAIQEADDQPCVVYQAAHGAHITFVRPVASWIELVELDGVPVPRFSILAS